MCSGELRCRSDVPAPPAPSKLARGTSYSAFLLTLVHIRTLADALLSGATRFGAAKLGFAFSPIVLTYLLFNTVVGIYNIAHWSSFSILKARMKFVTSQQARTHLVAPRRCCRFCRRRCCPAVLVAVTPAAGCKHMHSDVIDARVVVSLLAAGRGAGLLTALLVQLLPAQRAHRVARAVWRAAVLHRHRVSAAELPNRVVIMLMIQIIYMNLPASTN